MRPIACAILLVSLVHIAPAFAGVPRWVKDAIDDASAPGRDPEAPAEILYREYRAEFHRNGRADTRLRQVMRVLDDAGLGYAVFTEYVEPDGKLKKFKAWTLHRDGKTFVAGKGEMRESTYDPGGYTDVRRVQLTAPRARVGDIVALEVAKDTPLPSGTAVWRPQASDLPVRRAVVMVEYPSKWSARVLAPDVRLRPLEGTGAALAYELGPLAAIPAESSSPANAAVVPRLFVQLVDPSGEPRYPSWQAVADWYYELSRGLSEMSRQLPGLDIGSSAAASAVVESLAHRVRDQVAYTAIELGMARWVPDSASSTWRYRYGDCKDKAVLLIAALESHGIAARPVLACTRDRGEVEATVPEPFQFNHCIVAFKWPAANAPEAATVVGPSGERWTLFDPTDTGTSLGALPRSLAGTWAVIADPGEGLVRLPPAGELRIESRTVARLEPNGDLSGTTSLRADESVLRHLAGDSDLAARVLSAAGMNCEVLEVRRGGRDEEPVVLIEFVMRGAAQETRSGWIVTLPMFVKRSSPAPKDTNRVLPVFLDGPLVVLDSIAIEYPPEFTVELPPSTSWENEVGGYSIRHERTENGTTTERVWSVEPAQVPASAYAAVHRLWTAAHQGDAGLVILRRRGP